MNLEQQVTSLELSKKLKELGVKQESYFYWGVPKNGSRPDGEIGKGLPINGSQMYERRDYYSAFTVAELGEMLPYECESGKTIIGTVGGSKGAWQCLYVTEETYKVFADTEADARAKMLIYLIENKLTTL